MDLDRIPYHVPELEHQFEPLRGLNDQAHAILVNALPRLADYFAKESDAATLADIVAQVALEAPQSAIVFAERVCVQPEMLEDLIGLRRWVFHGLKQRSDSDRMLQNFKSNDPTAFSDQLALNSSTHFRGQIEALLHYFVGFGLDELSIDLHEPVDLGGPQPSTTISETTMQFPRIITDKQTESCELLYRAMVAHAAAHLCFSPRKRPIGNRRPNLVALIAVIEDARVERLMVQEYPGLHALWDKFYDASKKTSGFDLAGLMARLARALHDPSYEDPNPWVNQGRELFEEAATKDLTDFSLFDRLAKELTLQVGQMHLQLKPDHQPSPIYRDDNALLWGPNEALPEDETLEPETDEIEFRPAEEVPAEQDFSGIDLRARFHYPEWDHKLQELREDWTTVIEDGFDRERTKLSAANPKRGLRVVHRGAKQTPDRSVRLKRLPEGDDLDLNAVIDNAVEQRAGIAPDGRIFTRHGRRPKSTATIVLMDLSVSTEKFVPGSFTRVIDLEKQAAITVAEEMESESNRVAVHGFASNGRHEVNYYCVKDIDEAFDNASRQRLERLTSNLSTRMGAALRHATTHLDQQMSDNKVILLLTDGEPSDVDVIEDDYLTEDAHNAVVAASAKNIRTFCLTLDRRADGYVQRIFGDRSFFISDQASTFSDNARTVLARVLAP
ncbi:nitric oxide reductase activation protein NorD [Falsihalocynthiibacter arcticus]|uniref:VWFA domain-containing protein n=1 Tax=Falsihalocynthiibacter arcticus TaxID=1579316 RepID=A0A126V0V2_9RHOB|nr:VWA domain-containing protein [Falsihalocynthiibacter arcticus]AML51962.1 hypothetical protein RC74_12395 [Falsihalocynthiibacter arcticus]